MIIEARIPTSFEPSTTGAPVESIPDKSNKDNELKIALLNNGHYCGFFASEEEAERYALRCGVMCDALCKKRDHRIIPDVDTGRDCGIVLFDTGIFEQDVARVARIPFYRYNDSREWVLDEEIKIIIPLTNSC